MNDDRAIRLLEDIVRIPSPSYEEATLARHLAESLPRYGFATRVDDAGNLHADIGDGPLEGVLLGHIDTVPGMPEVRVADGRLYGRGSVDAKGPFACFLASAARAAEAGTLRCRLRVIGCVEEEAPSSKGARHVAPQLRPDFAIIGEPSGWDGITLGYKGFLGATLRCEGPGFHPAHDHLTACERVLAAWQRVEAAAEEYCGSEEPLFDRILPHLRELHSGGDGVREWAEAVIQLRLPVSLPPDAAMRWLRKSVPDAAAAFDGAVPAWTGERTSPLYRLMSRAILRAGGQPRALRKTGTADLNIVAPLWGCPALAYGPGDSALDHTPDEHIVLDEYLKGIAVLSDLLGRVHRLAEQEAAAPQPA